MLADCNFLNGVFTLKKTILRSMFKEIKTEIIINASPEKVWEVLTDFESYESWNPFVSKLVGEVKVGNTIEVSLPGMKFKPEVLAFVKNKEFRWLGHLLVKGLFDGEHCFEILDNNNGSVTFVHSEKFNGCLVFLFKNMLDTKTKSGFISMNKKLKERCEQMNS